MNARSVIALVRALLATGCTSPSAPKDATTCPRLLLDVAFAVECVAKSDACGECRRRFGPPKGECEPTCHNRGLAFLFEVAKRPEAEARLLDAYTEDTRQSWERPSATVGELIQSVRELGRADRQR